MNRLEATYAVDDIIVEHCKGCNRSSKMDAAGAKCAQLQTYCINDCPVGAELQELNQYFGGPLKKNKRRKDRST